MWVCCVLLCVSVGSVHVCMGLFVSVRLARVHVTACLCLRVCSCLRFVACLCVCMFSLCVGERVVGTLASLQGQTPSSIRVVRACVCVCVCVRYSISSDALFPEVEVQEFYAHKWWSEAEQKPKDEAAWARAVETVQAQTAKGIRAHAGDLYARNKKARRPNGANFRRTCRRGVIWRRPSPCEDSTRLGDRLGASRNGERGTGWPGENGASKRIVTGEPAPGGLRAWDHAEPARAWAVIRFGG